MGERNVRFTADEKAMVDPCSNELPRSRARHLLDQGMWLTGKAGDVLTREGEPVDHLYYLAEGEARVLSTGSQVGLCRPGDLIGELTVLSGETASATVILNTPGALLVRAGRRPRPYVEAHEDIRRAIEHGFATVLKAKLRASNRAIAEAAGRRTPEPAQRAGVLLRRAFVRRRRMTRLRISVMSSIAKRTPSRPRPLNP